MLVKGPRAGGGGKGRVADFRGLTEVSRALTQATSCDEVLALAVVRAQAILPADAGIVMLIDGQDLLSFCAPLGAMGRPLQRRREKEQDLLDADLCGRLGCSPQRRVVAVPLVVGGAVIGVLAVVPNARGDRAAQQEEWLLSALADQVAVAVEKMRLDEVAGFRERLIGIVSHDLRTPITAIALTADRLSDLAGLPDAAGPMVARIARSASRAEQMIRDLLDFTQIRLLGALPLTLAELDLVSVARDVIEEIASARSNRVQLSWQGATRGQLDAARMAQLIGNLVANALTYGDRGSPVAVQVVGEAGYLALSVHNEGRPIAASALAHIFEPMVQATRRERPAGGSLGLGLFICRHIAEAHHGKVEVTSDSQRGTTFRVQLPRR